MLNGKTIAVTVPAYNEENQIGMVIETMPDFVDRIIIVNDGSKDNTAEVIKKYIENDSSKKTVIKKYEPVIEPNIYNRAEIVLKEMRLREELKYFKYDIYNDNDTDRIVLINQENSGAGKAVATGYKWCRDHNIDCTAVMDGDGQMDPSELESIVRPVTESGIDYAKSNRLAHPAAKEIVPQIRYFGNSVLSLLTKITSGYWTVADSQSGFTAISLSALNKIDLYDIYDRYGYPNDLLVKLNVAGCTFVQVTVKPIYDVGEKSKMKIAKVIPRISRLLIKSFFKRLWHKYFIGSFHPLFILYMAGIIMSVLDIPIIIKLVIDVIIMGGSVPVGWYITFLLLTLFSFLSISFAMWMDIQDNAKLEKYLK